MYLVIDSALCRNRDGKLVFMQRLCTPRNVFSDYDFLGRVVQLRHTTRQFHVTQMYKGTVEKEVIFGIRNPSLNTNLFVGVVVESTFDFYAHIPKL